ncbi:methyl-accepting chemotaxis sensory transducer [Candidatus Vecturithrix granuli]|uniref:Methyl-accepting chemotaxis sensory transducer n=1 Tax=Vecturithrix granuli TaxID=1499967 RepID=A0A081BU15_VECG1|nr:methyl-accepting chemotaxis sensory transducer [Candidatus Vecturithrix granuli]
MVGGVVLGISLAKLWYLQRVVNHEWRGELVFSQWNYGALMLCDVAMVLILWVMLWRRYQITLVRPMGQLAEMITRLRGHRSQVSTEILRGSCEDIQELARATSALVNQVNALITHGHEVGQRLLETSHSAFAASKHQSTLLSEYVTASDVMARNLRDLVMTAQQISADGQAAVEVASRTMELAEQGQQAVMLVAQSIDDIRQAFQRNSDKILALGRHSEQIHDVAAAIDRMIEDTKLIAFNATIEAARARNEGRGFGVVAMEMKRLADEVCDSTEDMKEVIHEIQSASSLLVLGTEEDMNTVSHGARLAEDAGEVLAQILAMATLTTESVQRMASATHQHIHASEQVLHAVDTANQSTRRFAQESTQIAVAAAELSLLAEGLRQLLVRFGGEGVWEQSS